ncbi:YtpI family protein [Thalassobacillus hwangdonensis]|uniref:YtpI family protein n=1 Tax=Thalassobacillus hwangdonensis TaxID=546108 RepID=A0ABW3L0I2_9BACI
MFIFAALILISLVLYIYYKVAIIRTSEPLIQHLHNSKARILLGSFIFFFGINQYLFYETQLSLFVAIIFILIGIFQMYSGWKRLRHYQNEYSKHDWN